MSECSHDCSSCSQSDCGSREIPKEQLNEFSRVKKVIGIVSGKGGVGKIGRASCRERVSDLV